MIAVTRARYPEDQDETLNVNQNANACHPIYAANEGTEMLEVRRGKNENQVWRSLDNGQSWKLDDEVPMDSAGPDGLFGETSLGPMYRDPNNGTIIQFQQQRLFTAPRSERRDYFDYVKTVRENSHRIFYRVSRDRGESWGPLQQLVEHGDRFNERDWADGVTFLKGSAVLGEPPPFHKLADGRLVFPVQVRATGGTGTYGTIQAGRFHARWHHDCRDLTWRSGGRVPGGGCEQTTAVLKDGRILNVMRVQGQVDPYPLDLWQRPFSVSEDGGDTWCDPKPLTYDDGTGLTSPRAWSVLIRSDRNGRLYWIANILPAPETEASARIREAFPSRADPRYPLAIVEVDEETLSLKRDTLTVIQDREPDMPKWVRFSNYHVYNDRLTGDLVLLMLTSYCELQEDREKLPWPSYRYRIQVPA